MQLEALRNKERVKAQENRVADLLGRNNPPEAPHAVKVPPIPMQPPAGSPQKAVPGKHNGAAIVDVQVCGHLCDA